MNKVNLLDYLIKIKWLVEEEDRDILTLGICDALKDISNTQFNFKNRDVLNNYFESWVNYSGDITYPVPNPNIEENPYHIFFETENMWEGEYGILRIDLLNHIIAEVRKELKLGM